jgi:hypothetical protein
MPRRKPSAFDESPPVRRTPFGKNTTQKQKAYKSFWRLRLPVTNV